MFGKILYVSDNIAFIENKITEDTGTDLLNLHLIFENDNQRILSEITEVKEDQIRVKFLGEFVDGHYYNGILRKASLNCKIRVINEQELLELVGVESKKNFTLGKSATYKDYSVCPSINSLLANHLCIFGNTGSGKSCGVARVVQNILSNEHSLAYNANLIFFDSFGEYKNAFKSISSISDYYSYKFITSRLRDEDDEMINIPMNLLRPDDIAILLQADKHSQLTIIERAMKIAKIFSLNTPEALEYKNHIIAKALITVLYSSETTDKKKDEVFSIINTCHTKEFNMDTEIPGVGYTRSFAECFQIDSRGKFGEEVLITEYILKFINEKLDDFEEPDQAIYSLSDFSKAMDFTLISDGFQQNKNLWDDAQLLKVRLYALLHGPVGKFFTGNEFVTAGQFVTRLVSKSNKKSQIININLEGLDDAVSKAIVKIYTRMIFDFAKDNANRATIPFHLFLEEAHRYIQKDIDVFLLGYNIFERIAKEGRKYGVILGIISQRPMEISDTVVSQCSNFLIFKMTHPKDIKYIEEMLPNISQDVIEKMKILQPGTCVAFGSAFKIPMIVKLEMPNPAPYSSSCDVSSYWDSKTDITEEISEEMMNNSFGVTNTTVASSQIDSATHSTESPIQNVNEKSAPKFIMDAYEEDANKIEVPVDTPSPTLDTPVTPTYEGNAPLDLPTNIGTPNTGASAFNMEVL